MRKLFSILLSAAMILTLMPAMAFADDEPYVTNIQYSLAGNATRFTLYDGIDNEGGNFYLGWINGDTATVTMSNDSVRTMQFDGEEYVWKENGQVVTDMTPMINTDTSSWTVGNTYPVTAMCGADDTGAPFETEIATATIEDNPVTNLTFTASPDSASDRFSYYVGDTDFYLDFTKGDVLVTTVNGVKTTYTYDGETFTDGQKPINERFGYPYFCDIDKNGWNADETRDASIHYGGQDWVVGTATAVANTVQNLTYTPAKSSYSEADIRLIENSYPSQDWDETQQEYVDVTHYNYEFSFSKNDTLKVESTEGTVTYTYDGEKFVDAKGVVLEAVGPVYENDDTTDRITVPTGETSTQRNLIVRYRGHEAMATITVTKSSEADLALAVYKKEVLANLDKEFDKYDFKKYRTAQQNELNALYSKAYDAIVGRDSKYDIRTEFQKYVAKMSEVKTDAQLTEEERQAAEQARLAELEWNGTLGAIPAAKSVKASKGKAKVTAKWKKLSKKQRKKFDKVEVQVCPDRSFARGNTKRYTVSKTKKSKTVKGLSRKTTYYVRVRNVKGSGTGKVVSKWSGVKKVKTK